MGLAAGELREAGGATDNIGLDAAAEGMLTDEALNNALAIGWNKLIEMAEKHKAS